MASTIKLNNTEFSLKIQIYNDISGNATLIPPDIVKSLTITDDLYNPFYSGVLEIKDNDYNINRLSKSTNTKTLFGISIPSIGYNFRGDGHDYVIVEFEPHDLREPTDIRVVRGINCIFNIVDCTFNYYEDTNTLVRTLILGDKTYQLFKEHKSNFTTLSKTSYTSQRTNAQRGLYTGHALYNFITSVCGEGCINESMWDYGDKVIFYSAGANEDALTTLFNLYKLHQSGISEVNDACFLTHNMYQNTWNLISLYNYFKNAINKHNFGVYTSGDLNIDTIVLESSTAASTSKTDTKYIPVNSTINEDTGFAKSYNFKDINSTDIIESQIVYNYNVNSKQFNVDVADSNIDSIKKFYFNRYTSHLIGKNDKPFPNIPITQFRQTNGVYNNVFNLYENSNLSVGRNAMLNKATVLNNSIEVTTNGNAIRKSGLFINITGTSMSTYNDFDNKIFGTYLIVSSTHTISNDDGKFYTHLVCTKPYTYTDPDLGKDGYIHG